MLIHVLFNFVDISCHCSFDLLEISSPSFKFFIVKLLIFRGDTLLYLIILLVFMLRFTHLRLSHWLEVLTTRQDSIVVGLMCYFSPLDWGRFSNQAFTQCSRHWAWSPELLTEVNKLLEKDWLPTSVLLPLEKLPLFVCCWLQATYSLWAT
jgi:hypothetical protein